MGHPGERMAALARRPVPEDMIGAMVVARYGGLAKLAGSTGTAGQVSTRGRWSHLQACGGDAENHSTAIERSVVYRPYLVVPGGRRNQLFLHEGETASWVGVTGITSLRYRTETV